MIFHELYETETVVETHTCDFHKRHPGTQYPGCTCSGSYSLRSTGRLRKEIAPWPYRDKEADSRSVQETKP